jgi:hypothetical protein
MARRKALPAAEWPKAFQAFVDSAMRRLGRPPCIALEEDEAGGAELVASATSQTKSINVLGTRGQLVFSDVEGLTAHVYKSELAAVLQLLREYEQPDPEFDANLGYWSEWLPAEAHKDQSDFTRWLQ